MSSKLPFVTRLLDDAMRARINACAMGDQEAATRADRDVARLSAWVARLEPPAGPMQVQGWHDWHSLIDEFPWIKGTTSWLRNKMMS
jgi:hypothetical protein